MPSIEERLQRMEDIEAIKRLKYRYFRGIDTADVELLSELFTDDIEVDYIGGTYRWQVKGREALIQQIIGSFNPEAVGCHTGHHPEIDIVSENEATGIWYLTDIFINLREKLTTTGSALYRDRYERVDGVWKIKVTTYKRVYEQNEPFEKAPSLSAHHTAQARPKATVLG